jgi:hypothetical protein
VQGRYDVVLAAGQHIGHWPRLRFPCKRDGPCFVFLRVLQGGNRATCNARLFAIAIAIDIVHSFFK